MLVIAAIALYQLGTCTGLGIATQCIALGKPTPHMVCEAMASAMQGNDIKARVICARVLMDD